MDLLDRILTLLVGGLLGYLIAKAEARLKSISEEVHDIDTRVRKDESGVTRLRPIVLDFLLFSVVVMVAYSVYQTVQFNEQLQDNVQRDRVELCESGAESRTIQRDLVDGIYNLAGTAAQRPPGAPPLTEFEKQQYDAYIDRVNEFRQDLYDRIEPSEFCEPFVDDDNVEPKTPDYPHLKP
jgi:hypothetical protein